MNAVRARANATQTFIVDIENIAIAVANMGLFTPSRDLWTKMCTQMANRTMYAPEVKAWWTRQDTDGKRKHTVKERFDLLGEAFSTVSDEPLSLLTHKATRDACV